MAYDPGYSRTIPEFIARDKKLNFTDKMLYGLLASLAKSHGYCWATNKYLAGIEGVDSRTIQRSIRKLQLSKHIVIEIEDHNYRKLWTMEHYMMKDKIEACLGKDEFNQRFARYDKSVVGVRQICHPPAIYNGTDTPTDTKKKVVKSSNRAAPTSSPPKPPSASPPLFFQKGHVKLQESEYKRLLTRLGAARLDKLVKNLSAHLEMYPNSCYHKLSQYETIIKWAEKDEESSAKKKKNAMESGRRYVTNLLKLNPHLEGIVAPSRSYVEVGPSPMSGQTPTFLFEDAAIQEKLETLLRKRKIKFEKPE